MNKTVEEILKDDHKELDENLIKLIHGTCCLMGEEQASATKTFLKVKKGLTTHIQFEEETLFPEVEDAVGFSPDAGPTMVMRYEHEQFKSWLEQAEKLLAQSAGDAFRATLKQLQAGLHEHNMKEEQILYPMAMQSIEPATLTRFAESAAAMLAG